MPLIQGYAYTIVIEGYGCIILFNKSLHAFKGYPKKITTLHNCLALSRFYVEIEVWKNSNNLIYLCQDLPKQKKKKSLIQVT